MNYIIHTDGGSRGNPGPAATGYIIEGEDIKRVAHGEYIGVKTNNMAEYSAAIQSLNKLKSLIGPEKAKHAQVKLMADSELMVKQVNGEYKVKDPDLRDLFIQLHSIMQDFGEVKFTHIRREANADADQMVNEALDRHAM